MIDISIIIIVLLTTTPANDYVSAAIFGRRPGPYPIHGHRPGPYPAMADGTRMPPQPTTFSVGGMHLAIADGILCARFDGDATALSFAKEESWWERGSLVVEDHVGITSDREAGGQIGRTATVMSRACKAVASMACVLSD